MTREEYKNAVLQAKEHIDSGDIFQIVLSQRFERRTFADPFEVYRALRIAKGCTLVASSPDTSTRVKKVSKPGSVNVEKLKSIQRYSHERQMSSVVSGELLDHLACRDALQAALPVGTICGAPKSCSLFMYDPGDMDIGLALRTMVFMNGPRYDTMYSYTDASKRQEWVAHIQSEARIVNDSGPDEKQIECENKVACLCRAIDLAESAFVKGRSSVLEINDSVPNV
ncbi:hypothetical protein RDI58_000697 [Solanum bulbocastanum]|uniref:Chorismate-utilising enzyme C-terminal domain-containing protein n=1 Tax=Solanum bulbocastanum TaxID=147425 RepID=A0AAN8U6M7_SOLBU